MYSLSFDTAKSVTLKSDMNSSLQSYFPGNLALLVEILLKKCSYRRKHNVILGRSQPAMF
jgi:hypothetical protein